MAVAAVAAMRGISRGRRAARSFWSGSSGDKPLTREETLARLQYTKDKEINKLDNMAYKLGSMNAHPAAAAGAKVAATSTDTMKNYGICAGALSLVGGVGWFVLSQYEK